MPYKTPFGNHYHLKLGCNGAFIPCGASGLEPCSVCCGIADTGTSNDASGGAGAGSGTASHQQSATSSPSEPNPSSSQGTSQPQRNNGSEPTPSLKSQSAPQADAHEIPDLATRYAEMRRQFKGTVPPLDNTGNQTTAASVPATSSSQAQDDTPEGLVRRFSASHSAEELAGDADGSIRFELIKEIDEQVGNLELRPQRIAFLKKAQTEWNRAHPEAPILVWSEKDRGYQSDSPRGVLYMRGNPLQYSGSQETIRYIVRDKATGQDVTPVIHHYDFMTRQLEDEIESTVDDAYGRINRERKREAGFSKAFAAWRMERHRQSNKNRYKARLMELSPDELNQLYNEFLRAMPEYDLPELTPEEYSARYSDEEWDHLQQLETRHSKAKSYLSRMLIDYGISDDLLFDIKCQYCTDSFEEYDPLA